MTYSIPLRHVLLLGSFLYLAPLAAQSPGMLIYGTVRDMNTRDSIPFPSVLVEDPGSEQPPMPVVSNARGRYEIELTEQKVYLIRFGAAGKVGKSVHVDLRGPSQEDWGSGYGMNIDVTLLDSLPGVDYSVLTEPFGKARFNPVEAHFEWDVEYTLSQRDRQAALVNEHKERMEQQKPTR